MPTLPPSEPVARVGGAWRPWDDVLVHRSGAWVQPDYVWVRRSGAWRVIWARVPSGVLTELAALQGDGTVDVTFDAEATEAVSHYEVRRSDGTLVESVAPQGDSFSYSVTDSAPLAGSQTWTITPFITALAGTAAVTAAVVVAPAPGNVVAVTSNVGVDTDVTVTWDASPGAGTYEVRGLSGVLVGTTSALTIIDTNPHAGIGGYTVQAVTLGGDDGGEGTSNSLTLGQTPTGVTITVASIEWAPPAGDYDDVQVLVNGTVTQTLGFGITSANISSELTTYAGSVAAFTVRTRISENPGPQSPDIDEVIPALTSSYTSIQSTGNVGELFFSFGYPLAGFWTGFQVQRDDGGWADLGDNVSPVSYTWASGTGTRSMRVRTLSDGGPSDWTERSAEPLWDQDPPALPTITSLKPETTYGRMVMRFTTASTGNHQYETNVRTNGGAWASSGWTNVGNSQAVAQLLLTAASGAVVEARVRVRDSLLNTSAWSTVWDYTTQVSPTYVSPDSSGHWRQNQYGFDTGNPTRVYQGYFSTPSFLYYGLFYYGAKIFLATEAVGTGGGKLTCTAMAMLVQREGGGNNAADCVYIGTHGLAVDPGYSSGGMTAVANTTCIGTLTHGQAGEFALPASHLAALRDGSQYGLATNASKPYMFLYPYTQTFQGWIKITHLG